MIKSQGNGWKQAQLAQNRAKVEDAYFEHWKRVDELNKEKLRMIEVFEKYHAYQPDSLQMPSIIPPHKNDLLPLPKKD